MFRIAALLPLLLVSACGGEPEPAKVTNVLVSVEQQKADLARARDLGIITEEEYQQEVSEIAK